MGWSLTTQATPAGELKKAVEGFSLGEGATREDQQQLNAAKAAALEAFEREAVSVPADSDAHIVVQVQGNSTPGHQSVEGYPDSNVTIALFRVPSPTVPEPEPEEGEESGETVATTGEPENDEPVTPPAASEEGAQ